MMFSSSYVAWKVVGLEQGEGVFRDGMHRLHSAVPVVEGEVEYDDEDDDVLPREFRDGFEPDPALLELTPVRVPDWLNKIDDGSISRDTWSLESALQESLTTAWGGSVWQEEKCQVGMVDYHSINRKCQVAKKDS